MCCVYVVCVPRVYVLTEGGCELPDMDPELRSSARVVYTPSC